MDTIGPFISPEEAAKRVGYTKRSINRRISAGEIEVVCLSPHKRLIPEKAFQDWIERSTRRVTKRAA